jgi:hypothetical protein
MEGVIGTEANNLIGNYQFDIFFRKVQNIISMKRQTKPSKNKIKIYRVIKRQCVVCGKNLKITVYKDRSYVGGNFFDMHLKEGEYWECQECYDDVKNEYKINL